MILGAIEAGGTKMVCAIGDENGKILDRVSIPTKTPEETMPEIIAYFKDKDIAAIGLACFGPIDLHKDSPTYGYITSTPKTAWLNYDIVGCLKKAFNNIPIGFDTDVNGSLLGEATWGCAKGMTDVIYITIGTGIGGGVMSGGKLLHGLLGVFSLFEIRNLPSIFIHTHRYQVIMYPPSIRVLIQDIWLIAIAHLLHIFADEVRNLFLRYSIRDRGVDRCVERHILAADTAILVTLKCHHCVGRVIIFRGEDYRGLPLGNLPLIVRYCRAGARRRCVNLDYHPDRSIAKR